MLSSRRFLALLTALVVGPLVGFAEPAPVIKGPARWEKDIAAYEAADKATPPPKDAIVFVGSSSIRLWKTLAQDFPQHQVLNRGFGGSEMGDSAHFADRIVLAYQPRFIVVYAGGNDLNAKKTPEQVFEAFKSFVAKIRAKQKDTPIAYISIAGNPKRWAQVEQVRKANALIKAYTEEQPNLKFIDVFPAMLGADGLPKPDIFVKDNLHMNPKGYAIWTEIVGKFLPAPDKK